MKKNASAVVKKTSEDLLFMLGLTASIEVEEKEEGFAVSIETEDSSLLIGYHGENLEAFQLILALMVSKKTGEFKRILVNVGDYRERREERLKELAARVKQEALDKNEQVAIPNLSSSDRRIIHLFLQDDSDVSSESVGEGKDRQLVIKPKNSA